MSFLADMSKQKKDAASVRKKGGYKRLKPDTRKPMFSCAMITPRRPPEVKRTDDRGTDLAKPQPQKEATGQRGKV